MVPTQLAPALLLSLVLTACSETPVGPGGTEARIEPPGATLSEGGAVRLRLISPDGEIVDADWSSSHPAVATVDDSGQVTTGNALGRARITASAHALTASADVTVSSDCSNPVAISGNPLPGPADQPMIVRFAAGFDVVQLAQEMADFYGFLLEEVLADGFRANLSIETIASIRCRPEVTGLEYDH